MSTGETVFSKAPDTKLQPAMLTNIMVAILVLEECSDLDNTTIKANYNLYSEFHSYEYPSDILYGMIENGDTFTVREYLYALMLMSSCEAANILADKFGGINGIEGFVAKMNQKAKELGAGNTNFTNAHGLYDPRQYTTAADMAVITAYALKINTFSEICNTVEFIPTSKPRNYNWKWTHSNLMINPDSTWFYEGARGIKTGNLKAFGRNLITVCEKTVNSRGYTYLAVVLGSTLDTAGTFTHINDAEKMLNWATGHLSIKTIISQNEQLTELKVAYADDTANFVQLSPAESFTMLWNDELNLNTIQREITLEKNVIAPVEKGQQLGTVTLTLAGEELVKIPLVAVKDVDRSAWEVNKQAVVKFPQSKYLKRTIIILSVFVALYILLCITALILANYKPNKARNWRKTQRRRK
jgi:D-alanyl-D-alanine carboxypeptidase